MGEETVKDPEKGTDRPVSGAVVRIPVPRTLTYDVGKQMVFTSLGIDCGYSILPAAGLALSVVGEDVVITFLPGTTTLANVQAALAADLVAKEMLSLTGTAGTLPVGWAGGVGKLYNDLYAEAVAMLAQDAEGHWVPFSGKSLVVDVKMDAFAAVPDSALSVGTDDGLATGAKKVQIVTADGTLMRSVVEVATDAPKSSKSIQSGRVAYLHPGVLPADVSADGDEVPAAASRKGETFVYKSRLDYAEDASRGVLRIEQQPVVSDETGVSAIVVAAGLSGRMYALLYTVTVAGQVRLRKDAVVGGAIIKTFDLLVGANVIDLHGIPYGNGLYLEVVAGGTGLYAVAYKNDV